jgi:hypothetical protein
MYRVPESIYQLDISRVTHHCQLTVVCIPGKLSDVRWLVPPQRWAQAWRDTLER